MRPDWDTYFLSIAHAVAARSTCTRRQVGAVAVRRNKIVGTGYNGAMSGEDHCIDGACPRGQKSYAEQPAFSDYSDCIAVHAEMNALAGVAHRADTLYITCDPCPECSHILSCYPRLRVVVGAGVPA